MLAGTRAPDAPRAFAAAERGSVIVATGAIVVALFWVTDMFATFRGQDLARNINAGLWSRENVVVLDVDASQDLPLLLKNQIKVSWAPLGSDPTAKSTFLRYECFRELAIHNDRWVLVPARWAPAGGFAVIVTADSSHVISLKRIEHIADSVAAKNTGEIGSAPRWASTIGRVSSTHIVLVLLLRRIYTPGLRAGNWSGAAVAAADGLDSAAG